MNSLTVMPYTLIIENESFYIDKDSKENNGFIGFFDWLRQDEQTIIGIRFNFFEHHNYHNIFSELKYVKTSISNCVIELFFENAELNLNECDDKDFGNNFMYQSNKKHYLLTFPLDHLKVHEFDGLIKKSTVVS